MSKAEAAKALTITGDPELVVEAKCSECGSTYYVHRAFFDCGLLGARKCASCVRETWERFAKDPGVKGGAASE